MISCGLFSQASLIPVYYIRMSIVIFIIILAVLIFAHELGHFLFAKIFRIRVDEFALGFPPTLLSKKIGETRYALNLIPFGGYVKIHGENPSEEPEADSERSMINKPKYIQALVLIAGILFNIILAWVLISISLASGLPTAIQGTVNPKYVQNVHVVIADVIPNSPAEQAGIKKGDALIGNTTVEEVQNTIRGSEGNMIQIIAVRNNQTMTFYATPEKETSDAPYTIGIAMSEIGLYKVPWYIAPYEGLKLTLSSIRDIFLGLMNFIFNIFRGQADFSQVTGPVGIVGLVGEASSFGFIYLLGFTALISLNLAIINLMPFPALDGGRLLFVLIEAIKRSPIRPRIANTVNSIGFAILILLMLIVTYKDIAKLFVK